MRWRPRRGRSTTLPVSLRRRTRRSMEETFTPNCKATCCLWPCNSLTPLNFRQPWHDYKRFKLTLSSGKRCVYLKKYKVIWHDVLTNLLSLFCTCYLLFITFSMSHDTFHSWVTLDTDFSSHWLVCSVFVILRHAVKI